MQNSSTDDGDGGTESGHGAFDLLPSVEVIVRSGRALSARQDSLFHQVLKEAAADPEPWVGPDPMLDPGWTDPRGWSPSILREQRSELAIRAAAADLGARIHLSDNQVRGRAHRAGVLITRCPRTWDACLAGDVSEQNAMTVSQLADSLPRDPGTWAAFDEAVCSRATCTAPGRFRIVARAARERVHRESLPERQARAAAERYVQVLPQLDGMCSIEGLIPAGGGIAIDRRLDDIARHLADQPGETRSHTQLRADAFTDLLTGGDLSASSLGDAATEGPAKKAHPIRATVRITIPALTLLGHDDEPATLDGYGPIPLETARELAGDATSWIRVLTHPITGTVLDVDRKKYRVPADLKRWLQVRHHTCAFPGCLRPSDRCDNDHRVQWSRDGVTADHNLEPLCRRHHRVKDETRWQLDRDDTLAWTTPSGARVEVDPPPF